MVDWSRAMPILFVLLATAAAASFCILWLSARGEMKNLDVKLEHAKRRHLSDEQLKTAEAHLDELRRAVVAEQEQGRMEVSRCREELEEIAKILGPMQENRDLHAEAEMRRRELRAIEQDLQRVGDLREMSDLGFTRRQFTYEDPESYQKAIERIEDQQANMLKAGAAARCTKNWTIEGSEKKGEQMIGKLIKLALRAFNADADAAIARVTWKNLDSMSQRIRKSEETVEKTLDKWGIIIVDAYRDLKLKELQLTFERVEVEQRVREEQRALREQQREEEKARREAETAEREAEREERRVGAALEKAKRDMSEAHTADMTKHLMRIKELEIQLTTAAEQRIRAVSMAQLTKRGNVYIISNIGSFGIEVLKIGMTRRQDPMDRVWELSDASVPFDFDVHGMIATDDAPGLEAMLHRKFEHRRVNMVNMRKEFFRVTIQEVQELVSTMGHDVKLSLAAEAREHYETVALRTATR
jgi:hypothetical protein